MAETDYLADTRPNSPHELQRVERRRLILNLRRGGLSAPEISRRLATLEPPILISERAVRRTIARYLNKIHREDAESVDQLRALENERLDTLYRTYLPKAMNGEIKAAQLLIKLSERRAKMNGLDAPRTYEVKGALSVLHEMGVNPEEIERAEEAFRSAAFGEHIPDVEVEEVSDDQPALEAPDEPTD